MKILAFAATSHQNSINKKLVKYVVLQLQALATADIDIEVIDLIDYELPLYSQDREQAQGIPARATEFYNKITAAEAIIISFAEHNHSYTAVYKNLFDWVSRINKKPYQGTPMLIMSAAPGGRGGQAVLETVERSTLRFGMDVITTISVPHFQDKYDQHSGTITNLHIKEKIDDGITALVALVK